MAATMKRNKTKYPGVFYIDGTGADGKPERIFYVRYRKDGKEVEEKAGRQFQDDMTPAKASLMRTRRIEGNEQTNQEKRTGDIRAHVDLEAVFREYQAEKHHKASTADGDRKRFTHDLLPAFGSRFPADIQQKDFSELTRSLKERGLSAQSVKHIVGLLYRILKFSARQGYCDPPQVEVDIPRINNQKAEDLTRPQLERLIRAMDEDPHPYAGRLMKLALFTGMRAGELFKLQWSDIDLERGFILIREPKSGKDRQHPLNDSIIRHLETIPRTSSPFVFPSTRDGSQRGAIRRQAMRIKAAAGLPKDFRPLHGLRHVYASAAASSGMVDMYTLQKLLGHSSPQMTQRYAHLRDEALKRASEVMGDIFKDL